MEQSEQLDKEERIFLSLCCQHDRDMLTDKADMTLEDFERITFLTMALDYVNYTFILNEKYLDFANIMSEKFDREYEILEEYPEYYIDEEIDSTYQKWIDDFLESVPADKQNYCRERLQYDAYLL